VDGGSDGSADVGVGIGYDVDGMDYNLGGLIACRWFLGVFEAGLLPGCVYVVTMWYKRHEGMHMSLYCSL